MSVLTDYRVMPVSIVGSRGGLTRVWKLCEGPPGYREVETFSLRREALVALADLVNAAHSAQAERGLRSKERV